MQRSIVVDYPLVAHSFVPTLSEHLQVPVIALCNEHIDLAPTKASLLIELFLPDHYCGLSLARRLQSARPDLTSIVWSGQLKPFYIWASLESKIAGVLSKATDRDELLRWVYHALESKAAWDGEMIRIAHTWEQAAAYRLRELLPLDWQIWLDLIGGKCRTQISVEHQIAKRTVDRRITRLYSRLGATNEAEAITLAWQWGLLRHDELLLGWSAIAEELFMTYAPLVE